MLFQVCGPRFSRIINMTYRRYYLMYRVCVGFRQPYSTRTPHHSLAAAAQSNVAKKRRKAQEEEEDGSASTVGATLRVSQPEADEVGVHRPGQHGAVGGQRVVGARNEWDNGGKLVPLHEAVNPRELEWRVYGAVETSSLPGHYLMLAKFRLTALVMLTSVGGYVMAPYPLDVGAMLALTVGTGLLSSAANAINQFLEAPFDAQMPRTRNRALVRGLLTPAHAVSFAFGSSLCGSCILWAFTNPTTATLGILNLFLYTSAYTPLKRITIANTWVGSIVGAIPPLMGWAACSGGALDTGAWFMAGVLYAWQFPHFNALSWNLRQEYSRAGYRMMAVTNPDLCRKTSLRYSVGMIAICLATPVLDITTWTFAFDSLPPNIYLTYLAWKFYKESDSRSSRKLFRFTLLHLPVLMLLMLISKKHPSAPATASDDLKGNEIVPTSPANELGEEVNYAMPQGGEIRVLK